MTVTNKQVVEALETLKTYCREHPICAKCLIGFRGGCSFILGFNGDPCDWYLEELKKETE